MDDPDPSFALTIRMDPDGIEWTHFVGLMGHVRTPGEMPAPLWARLEPIMRALQAAHVGRFTFPALTGVFPPGVPDNAVDTLTLAAWWLEWDRRAMVARGGSWACPDCDELVRAKVGHCADPQCDSWNKLHLATGEPNLHLVPGAQSA